MKRIKSVISTLVCAALLACVSSTATAGLVSHWSFDSDLTDSAGSNDGTAVGAATIDTTDKKFGAGSLDVTSGKDYSDLGATITLSHAGGYSISLWAKQRVGSDALAGMVMGTEVNDNNFIWLKSGGDLGYRAASYLTGANTFSWASDKAWNHFVIVDDGTAAGNLTVYVNGVAQTAQTNTENFTFDALGYALSIPAWGLDGNLDEVWVFDHALNASEVAGLFNDNTAASGFDTFADLPALISIMNNGTATNIDVIVKNTSGSTQNLDITAVAVTGLNQSMFNVIAPASFPNTIAPGVESTITLQFSPGGHMGPIEAALEVTSNHSGVPDTVLSVRITGLVCDPKAFHIFLLMGQSNMAGYGGVVASDPYLPGDMDEVPGVYVLDGHGTPESSTPLIPIVWRNGSHPLHVGLSAHQFGLGMDFAKTYMQLNPGVSVGLIPCAWGGAEINSLNKGTPVYQNAMTRAGIAAEVGTIKGVLWHQGESDSVTVAKANQYGGKITQLVADLRRDLDHPLLPFVVGNLAEFYGIGRSTEHQNGIVIIRQTLRNLAASDQWVNFVETTGLISPDSHYVHFDRASYITLGQRYAVAMSPLVDHSFHFEIKSRQTNELELSWFESIGQYYDLQYRPTLDSESWETIATDLQGGVFLDTNVSRTFQTNGFYRMEVRGP